MAVRVTRVMAEVAGTMTANIRVTRTIAEVLGQVAQPDLRLTRYAIHILAEVSGGTDVSASSSVVFSQQDNLSRPISVAQTVTFSQTESLISSLNPEITQTVSFSQTTAALYTIKPVATSSVVFSQTAGSSIESPEVTQTVNFSDQANKVGEIMKDAADTVIFTQVLTALFPQDVSQTVVFSQTAGGSKIIEGGLERSAGPQTVLFTQTPQKVLIKAGATSHSATQTVNFTERVLLPLDFTVPQAFILSDSTAAQVTRNIEQDVIFDHSVIVNTNRDLAPTQTVIFSHAMAVIGKIDLCRYSPSIGASTDPNAPAPPPATMSFTKTNQVTLSYPTVSPTLSVSIRAPEFGDVHRLNVDRVNRESRGGSLQIFTDPDWPQLETLVLQFSVLKEAEAQAVLNFFQQTLGLEVKLEDWNGRTWHGFVIDPESPLVRVRRDVVDLSFEFQGEQQ